MFFKSSATPFAYSIVNILFFSPFKHSDSLLRPTMKLRRARAAMMGAENHVSIQNKQKPSKRVDVGRCLQRLVSPSADFSL
jgi:hypothetical protein